ncbi:hypothetical protein EVAR_93089_1 [Eumeta japonica]|uniref:Uncharacterized protein n=1 Tax=Eumeta variegata TaxID=151549 RepID=A0A4C1TF40_EUMVA|nr:hypothetical protein EVAR_93089_1 [Eumeta japonica]
MFIGSGPAVDIRHEIFQNVPRTGSNLTAGRWLPRYVLDHKRLHSYWLPRNSGFVGRRSNGRRFEMTSNPFNTAAHVVRGVGVLANEFSWGRQWITVFFSSTAVYDNSKRGSALRRRRRGLEFEKNFVSESLRESQKENFFGETVQRRLHSVGPAGRGASPHHCHSCVWRAQLFFFGFFFFFVHNANGLTLNGKAVAAETSIAFERSPWTDDGSR